MYAYFKKLDYHSTECIYSPTAYRGHARALVKDLEAVRPSAIVDIVSTPGGLSGDQGSWTRADVAILDSCCRSTQARRWRRR